MLLWLLCDFLLHLMRSFYWELNHTFNSADLMKIFSYGYLQFATKRWTPLTSSIYSKGKRSVKVLCGIKNSNQIIYIVMQCKSEWYFLLCVLFLIWTKYIILIRFCFDLIRSCYICLEIKNSTFFIVFSVVQIFFNYSWEYLICFIVDAFENVLWYNFQ